MHLWLMKEEKVLVLTVFYIDYFAIRTNIEIYDFNTVIKYSKTYDD